MSRSLLGLFSSILTIGCTVIPGAPGVIAPLAIGAALMVMVYANGHISGAHLNPAVTLAVFVRGRCEAKDVVPYWIAQCFGGAAAAFLAVFLCRKEWNADGDRECSARVGGGVSLYVRAGLRGVEYRNIERILRTTLSTASPLA